MGFITPLFNAIVAVPAIVSVITALVKWVMNEIENAQKRKASQEMAKAIEKAQSGKDTSLMDEALDPGKKK